MAWAVGQLGGKAQPLWVSTARRRYVALGGSGRQWTTVGRFAHSFANRVRTHPETRSCLAQNGTRVVASLSALAHCGVQGQKNGRKFLAYIHLIIRIWSFSSGHVHISQKLCLQLPTMYFLSCSV